MNPGVDLSLRARLSAAQSRGNTVNAVEKGIREAIDNGVLAGYPVVDIKADPCMMVLTMR